MDCFVTRLVGDEIERGYGVRGVLCDGCVVRWIMNVGRMDRWNMGEGLFVVRCFGVLYDGL